MALLHLKRDDRLVGSVRWGHSIPASTSGDPRENLVPIRINLATVQYQSGGGLSSLTTPGLILEFLDSGGEPLCTFEATASFLGDTLELMCTEVSKRS